MSEQRSVSPPPSRIGPTEPDDTMVICPVCTSQFRAIPLDVQRENESLRKGVGDIARAALGKSESLHDAK